MAGPFDTRELTIVNAIADSLVARTSVLKTGTVNGAQSSGATSLPIDSLAGWARGGYVHFFDNSGEPMTAIADLDAGATALTLAYDGYAEHGLPVGLQQDHADGAIVATNLMLHRPQSIGAMLRNGGPIICVWPRKKVPREFAMSSTIAPIVIRIQVHMSLQQFDSAPMDPEVYNQMQEQACWEHTQTILNMLDQNRHLHTRYNNPGPQAIGLGQGDGGSKDFATVMWDTNTDNTVDIPQVVGAMDVIVRPRRFNRQEPD